MAVTGAVVALVPTAEDAARLAIDGGEPAGELHLTLWYLGKAAEIPRQTQEALVNAVRSMVQRRSLPVVQARAFGVSHWNPDGEEPCWVLAVGDLPPDQRPDGQENLAVVREMISEAWHDGMVPFEPPPQHTPWAPHACLAYSADTALLDQVVNRVGPVTFDRVRVAFAGQHTDIPLNRAATRTVRDYDPLQPRDRYGQWTDGIPDAVVETAVKVLGGVLKVSSRGDGRAVLADEDGRSVSLDEREIEQVRKAVINAQYGDERNVSSDGVYRVGRRSENGDHQILVSLRPVEGKYISETGKRFTNLDDGPGDEEAYNAEFDLVLSEGADSDFDDEPQTRVSLKDLDSDNRKGVYETLANAASARRVDSGNGPLDVYTPRTGRLALRMKDEHAQTTEVEFNAGEWRRIDSAVNLVWEGFDESKIPHDAADDYEPPAIDRIEVKTAAGPVEVAWHGPRQAHGAHPDAVLTITPLYEAPWSIAIDGDHLTDTLHALGVVAWSAGIERSGQGHARRTFRDFDPGQDRWPVGTPGGLGGQWRGDGVLGEIIDDVAHEMFGGDLYVGLREDGTVDLRIGTDTDGPVGRFNYRDVEAVTDAMYRMWRRRGDDPAEHGDGELIDDTIVDTSRDRIYVAISSKTIERDGEFEELDVLTLGVPTGNDTEDQPDFHEIDLDEDDLDSVVSDLLRFREDYEPAEVESEGFNGTYDIALVTDHTIRLSDEGDFGDDALTLEPAEAAQLATAIRELLAIDLPEQPADADDPDVVDGNEISNRVDVSVLEDGSFIVGLNTADDRSYVPVQLGRDEARELAEVLDRYIATDSGPQPVEAGVAAAVPPRSAPDRPVSGQAALIATLIVDTLTGGRYTPAQQRARRSWMEAALRGGPVRAAAHWEGQPRDPGGEGGGRWVKYPTAAVKALLGGAGGMQDLLDAATSSDDPPPTFAALKVTELKALLGHAGLKKTGVKADLVDRLVGHVKGETAVAGKVTAARNSDDPRAAFAAMKVTELKALLAQAGLKKTGRKADLVDRLVEHANGESTAGDTVKAEATKATKKADAGEPLRGDGPGPLGEVPADGVRPDERPGDVLYRPGAGDQRPDSDTGGGPGGAGAGGRDVSGQGRPAELGEPDGEGAGAAGDAAPDGGGRGEAEGRGVGDAAAGGAALDAPVFRPRGQEDLAPATKMARLDANLAALRVLRRVRAADRPATADEQAVLARWSGWGSLPEVFEDMPPSRRWAAAKAELRDGIDGREPLLSAVEYEAAKRTTLNAHYTDAGYVQAVWDAMRKLGFDGGRVLEPGSGSGTFIGFAPEHARMVGVELDPVTAAISQALYPDADVRNESFAETRLRGGEFDAAVGNVPFGNITLTDKAHNLGRHSIHNHFIIKSLHGVRPGGLVAVLTSRYTMDSRNPAARREMADLGDLVGAVRLPSEAHRKAAGTDVVTDLLIFRRRAAGAEPAGLTFEQVRDVDVNGTTVQVNEAFVGDGGGQVLGRFGLGGMHGGEDLTVEGDADATPALQAALDRVVARAMTTGLTMTARSGDAQPDNTAGGRATRQPDGYLRALPGGGFVQVVGGVEQPHQPPAKQAAELRALLDLRDIELALLDAEAASAEDTDEMATLRARLNESYDSYLALYGPINRFTTRRTGKTDSETGEDILARVLPAQGGFRDDPFAASVRALETYDPVKGTTHKADIFTSRVVAPRTPKLGADTPEDALAIALDQTGRVELDMVARLLGVDNDAARRMLGQLVYTDPGSGELVPQAAYLSGNVREKLDAARLAAATDPAFAANVKALESALPPDLKPEDIEAKLGASWIGPEHVQRFLGDILDDRRVQVEHAYGSEWKVTPGSRQRKTGIEATNQWGTASVDAYEIAEHLLTQRPIKVYDRIEVDDTEKRVLNQAKTEAAQAKAEELKERFAEWVWQDPARADELSQKYNRIFNSMVQRTYDGKDLTLPGMATTFKPHPHVKDAVARVIAEPSVGLWHEVGAGKTAEMTISAMELRRLGLVRKPAIVVPNHMLEQFRNEFLEIYPQARLLAASSDDLAGDKRREFVARAATGDWDAVILTQGAFERIPVSAETQRAYLHKEVAQLETALAKAKAVDRAAGARKPSWSVKNIEKAKQAAEERIKANIEKAAKDPGITFEKTGVDYLFVDEAHTYKNLRRASAIEGQGIVGNGITTDLHTKIEYLRGRNPNGRVVTLATATPIANTMGEAHTMLRYLRPDLLEAMGVDNFDTFIGNFGQVVTGVEPAPEGGLRVKARIAKFVNLPELLRPWGIAGDVKTADDLEHIVKPPRLRPNPGEGGRLVPETVVVPPSEELKDFVDELKQRALEIRARGGGKPEKGEDNMLNITNDGRAAALDLRLVGRSTNETSKLDVAADNIAEIWRENRDRTYRVDARPDSPPHPTPGALQIVFADLGTPTGAGWNAYEELRQKLVAQGLPREQIRFIHEAKSDKDKAELFTAARDGRVAVLVGSTGKMGTGTNVQNRAIALHHLDVPWRPADVQQREGRIIRQKNQNPQVRVLRYVTEGSFDAYNWGVVARKAKFINQMMRGKLDVREMEDIGDFALSADVAAALADGNPLLIDHATARSELARLERAQRTYQTTLQTLRLRTSDAEREITQHRQAVADVDAAIGRRVDLSGDNFRVTVGGIEYDSRAEATAALRERVEAVFRTGASSRDLGQLGGFTIRARTFWYGHDRRVELELVDVPGSATALSRTEIDKADLVTRLQNKLTGLEDLRARHEAGIDENRHIIERSNAQLAEPFKYEDALRVARAHFEELDEAIRAMAGETNTAPAAAGGAGAAAPSTAAIKARLEAGDGFRSLDELESYLDTGDPDISAGARGAKLSRLLKSTQAQLTPGGRLLVHKNPDGPGYRIAEPRTMRHLGAIGETDTPEAALALAAAIEDSGIPWNGDPNDPGRLRTWRSTEGYSAIEVIALARAAQPDLLDKDGTWAAHVANLLARNTDDLADWSEPELRALLAQHGLPIDGGKDALLARLRLNGITVAAPDNAAALDVAAVRAVLDALTHSPPEPARRGIVSK